MLGTKCCSSSCCISMAKQLQHVPSWEIPAACYWRTKMNGRQGNRQRQNERPPGAWDSRRQSRPLSLRCPAPPPLLSGRPGLWCPVLQEASTCTGVSLPFHLSKFLSVTLCLCLSLFFPACQLSPFLCVSLFLCLSFCVSCLFYSPHTTVETLAFTCSQIHHYWLKSNGSSFLWMCPPKSMSFPESIARDEALGGGAGKQKQGSRPVGQGRKKVQLRVNSGCHEHCAWWGSTLWKCPWEHVSCAWDTASAKEGACTSLPAGVGNFADSGFPWEQLREHHKSGERLQAKKCRNSGELLLSCSLKSEWGPGRPTAGTPLCCLQCDLRGSRHAQLMFSCYRTTGRTQGGLLPWSWQLSCLPASQPWCPHFHLLG